MCIQCCFPALTSQSPLIIIPSLWVKQGRMNFPSFSPPFPPSDLLKELLRIWNFPSILRKTCSYCQVCQVFTVQFTSHSELEKRFLGGRFRDLLPESQPLCQLRWQPSSAPSPLQVSVQSTVSGRLSQNPMAGLVNANISLEPKLAL